jgi:hypothetical protein
MFFSKHQIDPAHIEAMRAAFRKVCDALLLKCDRDDPMTEVSQTRSSPLRRLASMTPRSWPSVSSITWLTIV